MCWARPGHVTAHPSTSSTILSTCQHIIIIIIIITIIIIIIIIIIINTIIIIIITSSMFPVLASVTRSGSLLVSTASPSCSLMWTL